MGYRPVYLQEFGLPRASMTHYHDNPPLKWVFGYRHHHRSAGQTGHDTCTSKLTGCNMHPCSQSYWGLHTASGGSDTCFLHGILLVCYTLMSLDCRVYRFTCYIGYIFTHLHIWNNCKVDLKRHKWIKEESTLQGIQRHYLIAIIYTQS